MGPKPTFPQHLEAVRLRELPGPLRLQKSGRAGGGRSQAAEPIPHRGGPGSDLDPPPVRLRPCLEAGGARDAAVRMERRPPGCSGRAGQRGLPSLYGPLRPTSHPGTLVRRARPR